MPEVRQTAHHLCFKGDVQMHSWAQAHSLVPVHVYVCVRGEKRRPAPDPPTPPLHSVSPKDKLLVLASNWNSYNKRLAGLGVALRQQPSRCSLVQEKECHRNP